MLWADDHFYLAGITHCSLGADNGANIPKTQQWGQQPNNGANIPTMGPTSLNSRKYSSLTLVILTSQYRN